MINFTPKLDSAIRISAWAHEQEGQHRKGGDIPYIIHPFGTMLIASNVTDDEDILIACLLHDVLEDVDDSIYDEQNITKDFGPLVVAIIKDVTKDKTIKDWHKQSESYLHHLEFEASIEAVIVSASDKTHNLMSTVEDHKIHGDNLWDRFSTKNGADQLWWYESVYKVVVKRKIAPSLEQQLSSLIEQLKLLLAS